jgi:hypothetical protein
VRVSLVYPADATPGHLLSVVPSSQLAQVQEQLRRLALARAAVVPSARPAAAPPPMLVPPPPPPLEPIGGERDLSPPVMPPPLLPPRPVAMPQSQAPIVPTLPLQVLPAQSNRGAGDLIDRYRQAIEAQRRMMQGWSQP